MNVDKYIRKKCLPRNALSACFIRSCIKFASLNWADIWIKKEDYKEMVQIYWAAYLFLSHLDAHYIIISILIKFLHHIKHKFDGH